MWGGVRTWQNNFHSCSKLKPLPPPHHDVLFSMDGQLDIEFKMYYILWEETKNQIGGYVSVRTKKKTELFLLFYIIIPFSTRMV